MKVLAIVFTDGELNAIRPEAELFIAMHKAGVNIDIICHRSSDYGDIFITHGLNIVGEYPKNKHDKDAIRAIHKLLIENSYNILHVLHRPAIVCGIKAAKGTPVKIIVYRGASGLYWHDPTAYENALNPRVDKVVCVCDDVRKNLQKQLFFNKTKALTIYKGHKLEWYAGLEKNQTLSLKKNAPIRIIFVANMRKWKGLSYFLKAIALLPTHLDFEVKLIGQGLDAESIMPMLSKNPNREKVSALGHRKDALELIASSDILVQYSTKNEGLSRCTIEAMCLGLTPVVSDAGGNPELVSHEESGLVVPKKNPEALKNALIKLIDDDALRSKYALSAKNRIRDHFSLEKTVKETLNLYHDILS